MKKAAVILAGSGFLDGAEIRESVLSLLELDKNNIEFQIFAPDKNQFHVINHTKFEESSESRNVLIEAARIARGKISPLTELNIEKFDFLVLPGGFGVAKNLSNLAFKGASGSLDEDFKKILLDFNQNKKPIVAICISPAVICLGLGHLHPEVTIGNDKDTANIIEALGGIHKECKANKFHLDIKNKIISTPAYMYDDARLADISKGIEGAISCAVNLI